MSTHKLSWNPQTKTVLVQPSTAAYPGGNVQLPNFVHDESTDPIGRPIASNHVLYHHIRDAMYLVGIFDMQSLKIMQSLTGGVGVTPGALGAVVAGTSSGTSQVITWSAPSTGTAPMRYQVAYRLGSSSGSYTNFGGTTTNLTATVTGLTANTAYDYQVTPINDFGTGAVGLLNDVNSGTVSSVTTQPRKFIAPSTAMTVNTTSLLDGATQFGANGGKAGAFNTTTIASNYGWYAALASAGTPVFTDTSNNFQGGWTSMGNVTYGGASWQMWRQDFPNASPTPGTNWSVA